MLNSEPSKRPTAQDLIEHHKEVHDDLKRQLSEEKIKNASLQVTS